MVDAWQATGWQVIALAPSARAAKELAEATGLPADTVAKYLHENAPDVWPVAPRYRLGPGAVMIVDETSMLSTVELHSLAGHVQTVSGKLLVVGDPAQIAAIDAAGGMLPALADRLGAPSLTTVHRLTRLWERHASLQLRAGDPACIRAYAKHDRVHPITPDTDPYQEVLTDYRRLSRDGSRVLLLARSHDDVDNLNAYARHDAINRGEVRGGPLLTAGGRDWREGDRLRVTRNDRRIWVGADHLRNGDQFTVIGPHHSGLLVQRLDAPETAVLPRDYLAQHARYGWGSTIDSAQGATVDHCLLLARPGLDRTRLYVAMTRGRQTNHVYVAPEPDPEIAPRDDHARTLDPADQLTQILNRTGEQAAAHTRLPEPIQRAAPPRRRTQTRTFTAPPRPAPRDADHDRYLAAEHQRYLTREHDRGYGRSR
jgi:ATP-dependent exoDNAse (exonuclease V) alpha subunit